MYALQQCVFCGEYNCKEIFDRQINYAGLWNWTPDLSQ
jgi:hypothetical protein